jgi:hypothetical protein
LVALRELQSAVEKVAKKVVYLADSKVGQTVLKSADVMAETMGSWTVDVTDEM